MTVLRIVLSGMVLSAACGSPPVAPAPQTTRTTYRIMSGVSMGATGAAALGFSHPEKFDGVAVLGGPLDGAYFGRMVDKFGTGGFCPLADLEAILARDPALLNDPQAVGSCSRREPTQRWEHSQDFNHWHYTSNGTSATRETYLDMFGDISLAYGNFATENPDSPVVPPGVPVEHMRQPPADFCTQPVRVKGLYNLEYNPQGKYDAITFCDGQPPLYMCQQTGEWVDFCSDPQNKVTPLKATQVRAFADQFCAAKGGAREANKKDDLTFFYAHAGEVDPCREAARPFTLGLAVDLNGNGRRDYAEPLLKNPRERFDDVGSDGCSDLQEDGSGGCSGTGMGADPNHDNYDAELNPRGTENDWVWQSGEPYRDHGLDGVPGTRDFGEGNGTYDMASGVRKFFAHDARSALRQLPAAALERIDVLVDGGIRDVFNLGVMSKQLFSLLRALRGESRVGRYRDFVDIPGMKDRRSGTFNPWNQLWATRVPRNLEVLYGKENPSMEDVLSGEGDHVGTPSQAVNRFNTLFNWAAATWPSLERPLTPLGGSSAAERQRVESFDSKALGAKWEYAIALPPGYDDPRNAEKRYPVLFLLHGYGMSPKDFSATSLITDSFVTDTDVRFRPMIMVFPNGRCCWHHPATGKKDCREVDETGTEIAKLGGWKRECASGSFYVNRSGYTANDNSGYGDAMFELMDHVDRTYRTLATADVVKR